VRRGHAPDCWCQDCYNATCQRSNTALMITVLSGFGLLALLAALVLAVGCAIPPSRPEIPAPAPGPRPPSLLTLHVQVVDVDGPPIAEAKVEIQDGVNAGNGGTTNVRGQVFLNDLKVAGQTLCAEAEGYERGCVPVTLLTSQNATIRLHKAAPPAPVRPKVLDGRLVARGRHLVYPDGRVFVWRGATGFQLLDHLADGRNAEAVDFAVWAREKGLSVLRVLAQADGMFKLSPEAGRAALPRLCALATEYDFYVEVVALADSAALQKDAAGLRAQVRAVGQAAAACPAFLVQAANEHQHSTQHSLVRDTTFLASLAGEIPAEVTYTLAPPFDDEKLEPTGEYVTRHRSRSRDEWNQVRRVRELHMVSEQTGRFVVDDEPIGADEQDRAGARESNCSIFFTQGALSRLFDVGSTYHFQDGLFAKVPRPNQESCAQAFVAGTRLVPDDVRLSYQNTGWATSPVADAHFTDEGGHVVRVYSGVSGNTGITVALGLTGDPRIVWANGWTPRRVLAERPGVTVWEIGR
jgi:hypothetical protein